MAAEFEVDTAEEFETMLLTKDIRISEALVGTILKVLVPLYVKEEVPVTFVADVQ